MFVTLEGIDRSGKSTQAALLADALGPGTLLLREPGGTPLSERIRGVLKDPDLEMDDLSELLLFNAARADLVRTVIAPARAAGRDVVCDRYVDSTAAYQGVARGMGLRVVRSLTALVAADCMPDLTILVRVDPDVAAARGASRLALGESDGEDRFEAEGLEFQRAVAGAYDELAASEPGRFAVVDGEGDPAAVHERVMAALESR